MSMVYYFAGINALLWPLQLLSSWLLARKTDFDAIVHFTDAEIRIEHQNREEVETRDWSWVRRIDRRGGRFWFIIDQDPPLSLNIPESALQQSEIAFLERIR